MAERDFRINIKARDEATKNLQKIHNRMDSLGKTARRLGGALAGIFAVRKITSSFNQTRESIDSIAKASARLGLTTEALSGLHYAAELTGVSTSQLEMGLQRMTRRVAEAAQGTGEAKNAIAELGLDAEQLATMSPDEQFKAIADQMQNVGSQSDRVRLGFKLFDSEGVKLINTLAGGSAAIEDMQAQGEAMGKVVGTDNAARIEQVNDAITRMKTLWEGTIQSLVIASAPMVESFVNGFITGFTMIEVAIKNFSLAWEIAMTSAEIQAHKFIGGFASLQDKLAKFMVGLFVDDVGGHLDDDAAINAGAHLRRQNRIKELEAQLGEQFNEFEDKVFEAVMPRLNNLFGSGGDDGGEINASGGDDGGEINAIDLNEGKKSKGGKQGRLSAITSRFLSGHAEGNRSLAMQRANSKNIERNLKVNQQSEEHLDEQTNILTAIRDTLRSGQTNLTEI